MLGSDDERAISPDDDGTVDLNKVRENIENQEGGPCNAFAETVLASLGNKDHVKEDLAECPICLDLIENPLIVPVCLHRRSVCR